MENSNRRYSFRKLMNSKTMIVPVSSRVQAYDHVKEFKYEARKNLESLR